MIGVDNSYYMDQMPQYSIGRRWMMVTSKAATVEQYLKELPPKRRTKDLSGYWNPKGLVGKMGKKPDMGKSCVRFRKLENIPLEVIGQLIAGTPPEK